jgi:hypothetical protein
MLAEKKKKIKITTRVLNEMGSQNPYHGGLCNVLQLHNRSNCILIKLYNQEINTPSIIEKLAL